MSRLPRIAEGRRGRGIAAVAALALGQAAAAGMAAFATRDVFAAFRDTSGAVPVTALVLIAAAGITIAALRIYERVVAERLGQDYAASLRLKLFTHLAQMSARDVAERRSGALAMRFVGDLAAVRGWVSMGIARLISSGIVLPAACAVLFLLNPALGMAATIPVVLGVIIMALASTRLGPAHRRLRSRRARLAADMSERIPHAPELRLMGRTRTETAHLIRRTERMVASALDRARAAGFLRAVPDAVSGIAAALVLFVALGSGAPGAEAAGALAALGLMVQPIRDLAGVWDRHRAWVAARDKCERLLAAPRLRRPRLQDVDPLPDTPPALRFAGVSAGLLNGIDAAVAPGRKVAIIGGNGAGKSTLLALAAGLERPTTGTVTLAGRPPSGLGTAERRRTIALMGARSPILAGSLRRALTMGLSKVRGDEAIRAAAEVFGLKPVIARLGGLDGRVGEAGRTLSSGEVRRVLLTRAALAAPKLMLLDEPDDALDAEGVMLVDRLVRGSDATTLVVTHNLALARRMDELWFVQDGRIAEVGPPAAVLSGTGPTASFFDQPLAA